MRDQWRSKARHDLKSSAPQYSQLLDNLDEYVAHMAFELSGQKIAGSKRNGYVVFLLVSFARTHMTATDLARSGDLLDSAILVRKQMESLSRLQELTSSIDLSTLIRRTPNVGQLRSNLNHLYGDYSEIAHSSDPTHQRLLGLAESGRELPLYPKYSEHALVSIGHIAMTIIELFVWVSENLEDFGFTFDRGWGDRWWAATTPTLTDTIGPDSPDPYDT